MEKAEDAMHVRILRDHDYYWPDRGGQVVTSFKEGQEPSVKRSVGEALIAAGAAEAIPTPASKTKA